MSKPLIFVVEDEPDLREIMLYNLGREGYEVEGFESGSKGLEAIRAKQPNLVILDLMLPDMDGLTVCCLLYTSPSPRDQRGSRMPSSA